MNDDENELISLGKYKTRQTFCTANEQLLRFA